MIKLITLGFLLFSSSTNAQQTFNKLNANELVVTSTTKASKPCPAMTETQRNAIASPVNGFCIYNTTTSKLNVYNGAIWKAAGGGVDNWGTGTVYAVNDIVIESSKIYQCLIAHTSGTFATDLAASRWVEISSTVPVNLTGPITSVGNATSIASQTGTGSTFVVQNTPTLTTPDIGAATGTSLTLAGNISAYNYDKDNLLINGNIENPLSSEWTCTVGTCTRTTTAGQFSKDTAALSVALSAQAMNVSQTVTTPSGIQKQGFVRVIYRVPATMADFQICSLVDGVEQACIPTANLIKDDTFRPAEIPLTFGTTSAGIKFKTTSSYTANAYFDGAILAQGLGTQNLQGDTVYSAKIQTTSGTVTDENKDWISSCTAANPTVCTFVTGIFTVAPNCTVMNREAGGATVLVNASATSATSFSFNSILTTTGAATASVNFMVQCQKQGNDYLAASSNVYAASALNVKRAGSITPIAGTTCGAGNLLADGSAISRTTYAELFREIGTTHGQGDGSTTFNLPDYRGRFLRGVDGGAGNDPDRASRTAMATGGNTGDNVGSIQGDILASHNHTFTMLNTQGVGVTWPYPSTGGVQTTTATVNNTGGNETRPKNANVNYCISTSANNIIVGSFAGIETCNASTNECDDTFSATVSSAGVVSGENKDWINGNCTNANPSVCTFVTNTFTVTPNCSPVSNDGATYMAAHNGVISSSSISVYKTNTSTGANSGTGFTLSCQKTGVDYKPKTAKVASSIGVPTVPGITTEAIDVFSFTYGTGSAGVVCSASPCSYLDQIGSAVTSVTRSSTGTYTLNLGKTYSKLKCSPTVGRATGASLIYGGFEDRACSSCSTLPFSTYSSAATIQDSFGTIQCMGSY